MRKHTEADYHLIQFRGPSALLEQLDHNLKITDGILRFRIIKLRPAPRRRRTCGPPPWPRLPPRRARGRRAPSEPAALIAALVRFGRFATTATSSHRLCQEIVAICDCSPVTRRTHP